MKSVKKYIILAILTIFCSGITNINAMQIREIPIQVQQETREVLQQAVGEVHTALNEFTGATRTTLADFSRETRETVNQFTTATQRAIQNMPREFSRSLLSLSIGVTGLALIAGTLWNMMHQEDSHPQNRRAQTAALALGFTGLTYSIWSLRR